MKKSLTYIFTLAMVISALSMTHFNAFAAVAKTHQVAWTTYNERVFVKSKKENRPILLFVEATWCPHCTKMKETTLESPGVVKLINESFIPIMIDIDKHKELAQKYFVMKLPTFIILDSNDKAIDSFSGEVTIVDFMSKLSEAYQTYKARMASNT